MKNSKLLDLYSGNLNNVFGPNTATGLFSLLDGEISRGQIQCLLAETEQI